MGSPPGSRDGRAPARGFEVVSDSMARSKGYVVVLTGDGKGKTTSALGMALRACGHGARVAVLQFIKSGMAYGECFSAKSVSGLEIQAFGLGCVGMPGDTRSKREHVDAAAAAMASAREKAFGGRYGMVVLDEINVALSLGLIQPEEVLSLLDRKPEGLHLVLTGRDAPSEILDRADLVTEMKAVKHPYEEGNPPLEGIEY